MLKVKSQSDRITVVENWLKPPKLVQYTNSFFVTQEPNALVCQFYFPEKYSGNDFYLEGEKFLNRGEMFYGKRFFYTDRFYSLLEFYSEKDELTAYYIDITLPAIVDNYSILIADLKLDFMVKPHDIKGYLLLDEDELEEAIEKRVYTKAELEACYETRDFIRDCLEADDFGRILTDYKRSSAGRWKRYREYKV